MLCVANACQLGTSSTLIPTQIVMFISVNGSQQVTINKRMTLTALKPGQYTLRMKVTDNKSNQTLTPAATFRVIYN